MNETSVLGDKLNTLLEKYVDPEGTVNYFALQEHKTVTDYAEWLETFDPESLKTENEKIAFWINTYNTLTIHGVLSEIRKNPDFAKKGNKSLFKKIRFFWWKKYTIGGKKYSLYQIENKILRKKFSEPRIHFALNCASQSCPLLKDGLYSAENLDQELETAATLFIRSPSGAWLNRDEKTIYLSRIFKWYKNDFEKAAGTVIEFVKKYLSEEDRKFIEDNLSEIKIIYQEYDWGLNIKS